MSNSIVRVDGFSKSYGGTLAVNSLSFEVFGGEIFGLLGPNGAGKTTTLKTLAGIISPTSGRLSVGGADIVDQPISAKQKLAFIPDDPRLFDTLTVWEHIQFVAAAYQVRDYECLANELLLEFELDSKRNALTQELSRGMRQKLAIVCAYLHQPVALLFDEPLTGLDPHSIDILQQSIRKKAEAGCAILISSHLLSLIDDHCTHILILDKGVSKFDGPIAEAKKLISDDDSTTALHQLFFKLTRRDDA